MVFLGLFQDPAKILCFPSSPVRLPGRCFAQWNSSLGKMQAQQRTAASRKDQVGYRDISAAVEAVSSLDQAAPSYLTQHILFPYFPIEGGMKKGFWAFLSICLHWQRVGKV